MITFFLKNKRNTLFAMLEVVLDVLARIAAPLGSNVSSPFS